jgi:rubredoxin
MTAVARMKPHYRCDMCGALYREEHEAYACCPHSVSVRWVCTDCGWDFRLEALAKSCRREDRKAAGLESAGG